MKNFAIALTLCTAVSTVSAQAEETSLEGKIGVELNATQTQEANCKLTFVITNGLGKDAHAVYETVLFDTEGQVNRLTLFDFGKLPFGRPRVRQFEIANLQCEKLGRVLFNGAHACAGEGIDATKCESGLHLSTRTSVEVLG
ncbi:MAG: hypothetical protein ABJJ53_14500 [Sulfitobacter sp.]